MIPPELEHWRVDEVIEALDFSKEFGWDSEERKEVEDALRRHSPVNPYSEKVSMSQVWDKLDDKHKRWIIKAYNTDIYGQSDPIEMEKYLNELRKTMKVKEKDFRKLVREEVRNIIQEENKGVLYSYAGDINIYDLTRSREGGGTGPPKSGSNVVALEFGGNRVELNPNETKSLFKAVETIYRNRK